MRRRVVPVCLGALAFLGLTGLSQVLAQDAPPTSTTLPATTTTTAAPVPPTSSTTVQTTSTTQRTTTTVKGTATTVANGGRPVPPPASGPTQTLVPDLLGTPVEIATTTPLVTFAPLTQTFTPTTFVAAERTATLATQRNSPSGATLILAAVAWLASFGGVLVYAEDRRSIQWKHLAR